MGKVTVQMWGVSWREGRPRFTPGQKIRKLTGNGHDLKHPDGRWYSLDESIAWSRAKEIETREKRKAKAEGRRIAAPRAARGLTLAELVEEWRLSPKFRGGVHVGKRKEAGYSENSIRDYKYKMNTFLRFDADLAASPPAAITEELAQAIYERMWEQLGLPTANGVVAVLSVLWGWAGGVGKAGLKRSGNPWKAVNRTSTDPRVVVLEDFEISAWVAACDIAMPDDKSSDQGIARPELGDSIFLGLFTGQRQGDRLAMLDTGKDDAGRRKFKQNKTGAIVTIPETPQLAARLAAASERRKRAGIIDPHVVLDERKGRLIPFKPYHYRHLIAERRQLAIDGVVDVEATAAARALHVAEKRNSEPPTVWKLKPCPSLAGKHDRDLRDTAVTWLGRANSTVIQISAITGHSLASIHTVLRHYLAMHPEMADAAIGKLVEWMETNGVTV